MCNLSIINTKDFSKHIIDNIDLNKESKVILRLEKI